MGDPRSLSSSELMHIAGDHDKHIRILRWHNTNISIRKIITLDEFVETVMNIVDTCIRDNGDVSIELFDFSMRVNIVGAYAYVSLPEDLEDLYYLMYSSDLFDFICENANNAQIAAIKSSARDKLRTMIGGD